jgi:isocitrate/isopropylmalate dehydrogenase
MTTPITVAYGDGIGPEIMEATLYILREAGANITVETIEIGERVRNMGAMSGILASALDTLRRNKILLRAPATNGKEISETISDTLGDACVLFETTHGTAPHRAGKHTANPSEMIRAAIALLRHIGQIDLAENIYQALVRTAQHAADNIGTQEFAEALVKNLHHSTMKAAI